MNFDQDVDIDQQNPAQVLSLQQKQKIQAQVSAKKSSTTIKFEIIVKLFQKMSSLRGVKKSNYLRQFLKTVFKSCREPAFVYSLLRILLPSDDRDRGNYGLKQKGIAKVIADCLGLKKQDYDRLYHYKNPNFHQTGFAIGDFSLCVFEIAQKFCKQKSQLTIMQLNILLDQLSLSNGNYSTVFMQLFQKCNPQQMKWIIRIVLKDLKLSIKLQTVLNCYHKDAYDYFNLTNNLLQVCKKFQNPSISLDDQISLFNPIRSMLAGKKNINYFKSLSHPYFIQTKYDGQRIQAHFDGTETKLFSRNAVNYSHVYKQIIDLLKDNIQADACILDGEVIVLQKQSLQMVPFGMNKVVALSNNQGDMQLCYMVFDILWVKIQQQVMNMMKFPLKQRKKILQNTIKQVPGRLQIVQHKVMIEFDDILQEFGASTTRNEQGIMLKDPQSLYAPKQRGLSWLKLKGDYIDGLTDTLDLIIIGGYFGDKSYRQGDTGHWIDKVTTFALGVMDKKEQQSDEYVVYPFCKVGTGYNAQDLALLREKLKHNITLDDNKFYPQKLKPWKYSIQDKPDCWIKSIQQSILLQVKAAQIITSDSYPTGSTLRFPRVIKIRYDKDWHQTFTLKQLQQMRNNTKYAKNMKKLNDESGSDGEKDKKGEEGERNRKKIKGDKGVVDKKGMKNILLDDFKSVELGENDRKKSNLFYGLEFVVMPLVDKTITRHQIQRQIIINGGSVSQNPLAKTNYIVADHIDFRLKIYQTQKSSLQIIKPKYILSCIKDNQLLPITPLYLTCLPPSKRQHFLQHFDKFCDSYTGYLNQRQLDEILLQINDTTGFAINQKLINTIGVKQRRAGMKSLCMGLSRLQVVRLKSHGNTIVEKLDLAQKIDTIIIKTELQDYERKAIDEYRQVYPDTVLEYAEDLKALSLI